MALSHCQTVTRPSVENVKYAKSATARSERNNTRVERSVWRPVPTPGQIIWVIIKFFQDIPQLYPFSPFSACSPHPLPPLRNNRSTVGGGCVCNITCCNSCTDNTLIYYLILSSPSPPPPPPDIRPRVTRGLDDHRLVSQSFPDLSQ